MKRSIALVCSLILMMSLFCGSAKAATYASDYLDAYDASLSTGSRSGQLSLFFCAYASDSMTSLGISSIAVYTARMLKQSAGPRQTAYWPHIPLAIGAHIPSA